mmetsp:Transcript_39778/g.105403  ORF Transcript_39778/g.105403 Transcript_39778/m.105403 type:complete len:205 (+) Transcript_39778:1355-1969(+)
MSQARTVPTCTHASWLSVGFVTRFPVVYTTPFGEMAWLPVPHAPSSAKLSHTLDPSTTLRQYTPRWSSINSIRPPCVTGVQFHNTGASSRTRLVEISKDHLTAPVATSRAYTWRSPSMIQRSSGLRSTFPTTINKSSTTVRAQLSMFLLAVYLTRHFRTPVSMSRAAAKPLHSAENRVLPSRQTVGEQHPTSMTPRRRPSGRMT